MEKPFEATAFECEIDTLVPPCYMESDEIKKPRTNKEIKYNQVQIDAICLHSNINKSGIKKKEFTRWIRCKLRKGVNLPYRNSPNPESLPSSCRDTGRISCSEITQTLEKFVETVRYGYGSNLIIG
jgi:hypothetical protein